MTYFYAAGPDKAGNTLITSYKKREQAERYRAGAEIYEGLKYLHINGQGESKVSSTESPLLLRTMLSRVEAQSTMDGPFVVYAKINDVWQETQFRYPNYAAANAAVKGALINLYDACAVIEEDHG